MMDPFKFDPSGAATDLHIGKFIQGYDSFAWVERYVETGDFAIVGKMSSGLKDFLPLGTLISHTKTLEVMVVENQEIQDDETSDSEPTIAITGRSLESYLENRQVGVNQARTSTTIAEYTIPSAEIWDQAVTLINAHIVSPHDSDDDLNSIEAITAVPGSGTTVARTIERGSVLERLQDLLKLGNLGVRTLRRNDFGGLGSASVTYISIYKGQNKAKDIIFSWKEGDLLSARYLFSQKKLKNSCLVVGRYVFTVVDTGPTHYDRRIMAIDSGDLDQDLTAAPTGGALTTLLSKMEVRGLLALAKQNRLHISQANIANTTQYQYRRDYNVGDMVTLDGNYGQTAVTRITEVAEIEDETGVSIHPTLELAEDL